MYIDSSNGDEDEKARIESPSMLVKPETGPYCLTLFYHMYGSDIGQLIIKRRNSATGEEMELFNESGEFSVLSLMVHTVNVTTNLLVTRYF